MVVKQRSLTEVVTPRYESVNFLTGSDPYVVTYPSATTRFTQETMQDSSSTGSARTEVDAVDRFMADPTNRADFHRALFTSNESAGDAGLAEFSVNRHIWRYAPCNVIVAGSTWRTNLSGWMWSEPWNLVDFPSSGQPVVPSREQLADKGQDLYFRALPNRDQADLGQCLGEVLQNPIRAMQVPAMSVVQLAERKVRSVKLAKIAATKRHERIAGLPLEEARAAADDYLAYIFGARPTQASIDMLASSLSRSRRLAETVSRDGSRRIRRRRYEAPQYDIATSTVPDFEAIGGPGLMSDFAIHGTLHRFQSAMSNTWWSGSFRMSVSDTDDWLDKSSNLFKRIDLLTGLGLDIKTCWDLIPFSFMADWFANTGDLVERRQLIADYNIACEYGYVMCHTRFESLSALSGLLHFRTGFPGGAVQALVGTAPASTMCSYVHETKQRQGAKAFGFKTDFANLNSYQWSALSALGLTFASGTPPRKRT